MLSKQAVEEYKQIYIKEFGIKLNDTEVNEQANRLLNFFKLLIEIDQRNKDKLPKV